MLNRREFLKYGAGTLTLVPLLSYGSLNVFAENAQGITVNDVHSQLNETTVFKISTPKTTQDLQAIVKQAQSGGYKISIAGARHAMGTQQFGTGTMLVDIRSMEAVVSVDREKKIVEVQSGITWPKLIHWLNENAPGLSIIQKQTGADELTIGGALAANVHGRGLKFKPFVGDVESFTLINANGKKLECSRKKNKELFSLVIGGYGLFGIIDTVKLRLMRRIKLQRAVEVTTIDKLMPAMDQRIADGYLYGDFQYITDLKSEDVMRKGIFSCYKPVPDDTPISAEQKHLNPEDWQKLYNLAHTDKLRAYERYRDYYLSTNGQVYWSDNQNSIYLKDQNKVLNKELGLPHNASLMISELYAPRDKLTTFMESTRNTARENEMDIIYSTVRLIEKDDESFLPWAKESYACVIFNLHVMHTPGGIEKAQNDFRALIDQSLAVQGSYYLTYHRWARKDQVESAYPQFAQFLQLKKKYDPEERFSSDWYQHYKQMFGL